MLLEQVKRTIDHYQLLERGDRLIVGVSAGVDSMVLLHVLNAYRPTFDISLIVAHVNHGLRPQESEKEAELVQKESERLGLTFEYKQFNVKEFQKVWGFSLQEAARAVRFQFFNSLFEKYHAKKIALGHHADDQVETVLLRLLRGSGLNGLKGMLPIREGKVIRPLLEVWRSEIECFAEERKIPFLFDSSNLKKDYLRNQIRQALIPQIEKQYQPNFKKIVFKTSIILREENDYLEKETEKIYQEMVHGDQDVLSFKFSKYYSLHPAIQRRIIQKMLGRMINREEGILGVKGWEVDQIYKKLNQKSSSFLVELLPGISLEKKYDSVFIKRGKITPVSSFEVELISPGRTYIEEIKKEFIVEEIKKDESLKAFYGIPNIAFLDYQHLKFPIKVRNFRPGDRIHPLGLNGTQKLKEFFIDHKIPKHERNRIPLLTSGEMIAWVVGYRIDERVKVTKETQRVLKIKVI